jgi:hypothetical protein
MFRQTKESTVSLLLWTRKRDIYSFQERMLVQAECLQEELKRKCQTSIKGCQLFPKAEEWILPPKKPAT